MNVVSFSKVWKSNRSCEECSNRFHVFSKKKTCFFCKKFFCNLCIMHHEDKKTCCRKCQILTARPLDRNKLLNLKSRDLLNYLTSKHISTNGCVEKEDLVNVLMRTVNNSCFHPLSNPLDGSSCASSCPNTPRNHSVSPGQSNSSTRHFSHSVENLFNEDGIRIRGHNAVADDETQSGKSGASQTRSSSTDRKEDAEEFANSMSQETDSLSSQKMNISGDGESNKFILCDPNDKLDANKPLTLSDIKSSSDLDSLSVKQLKELLMKNRTDFKGCIEKTELLQKANRLWSDYVDSRKDLDNLSLDELCKICMDAPIECVLLECGHMATCTSCGKQLCECPICRQFVVRCVRTFKA